MQVNIYATVGRLVTLTERLQTELDNLTDQVEQLWSGCDAASLADEFAVTSLWQHTQYM